MIRNFGRTFSSIQQGGSFFNLSNAWKRVQGAVSAPSKHLKRTLEPSGQDYNPLTNTTEEAFDEVAQEWQALIIGNPYDLNTFNMLEGAMIANFGTVDNPHVIFTSDAPFRYVGCSGAQNEDDYEGHELMMFMLREGPLQRCPSCGQVFKLVRLRNEFSPEMDYNMSNFIPYEVQEMGEMDTTVNLSIMRMQKDSYEHSQFEVPTSNVYSLVNPDEHDRLLTDPAYRLQRSKIVEDRLKVYVASLQQIEKEYHENNGPIVRHPMNKVDYETLIDCEKAIMKLDRHFQRVQKFESRKFIDRENHARREKRMLDRVSQRWENNYTIFVGQNNEEEQRYRDYFETDLEKFPEDENIEEQLDTLQVFASGDYNLDKYDFQEGYTRQPEEDASSLLEKKLFKFRYRMAQDTPEEYNERQLRMITRQTERFRSPLNHEILENYRQATKTNEPALVAKAEKEYLELIAREATSQYKDYFEDDKEENFEIFDHLGVYETMQVIKSFENFAIPRSANSGYISLPKREWSNSSGLWSNFLQDYTDALNLVPTAKQLLTQIQLDSTLVLTEQQTQDDIVKQGDDSGKKIDNQKQARLGEKADKQVEAKPERITESKPEKAAESKPEKTTKKADKK